MKLPSLSKKKNEPIDTEEYGYDEEFEEDSVHELHRKELHDPFTTRESTRHISIDSEV